jgi:hypothetical protein
MFVLTIADEGADPEQTPPLLVTRTDGSTVRPVLGLVLDHLTCPRARVGHATGPQPPSLPGRLVPIRPQETEA